MLPSIGKGTPEQEKQIKEMTDKLRAMDPKDLCNLLGVKFEGVDANGDIRCKLNEYDDGGSCPACGTPDRIWKSL